jgi:hypothetical protein
VTIIKLFIIKNDDDDGLICTHYHHFIIITSHTGVAFGGILRVKAIRCTCFFNKFHIFGIFTVRAYVYVHNKIIIHAHTHTYTHIQFQNIA